MNAKLRFFVACFVAVIALHAEELQAIPADEMAKATPLLMEANTRLGELPLKLELDAGKAMGLKTAEVGLIVMVDTKLTVAQLAAGDLIPRPELAHRRGRAQLRLAVVGLHTRSPPWHQLRTSGRRCSCDSLAEQHVCAVRERPPLPLSTPKALSLRTS